MNCKFLRGAPENKRLVIPIRIGTRGGRAVLSNLRNNLRVERWPDSGAKRSFRRQWGRARSSTANLDPSGITDQE